MHRKAFNSLGLGSKHHSSIEEHKEFAFFSKVLRDSHTFLPNRRESYLSAENYRNAFGIAYPERMYIYINRCGRKGSKGKLLEVKESVF